MKENVCELFERNINSNIDAEMRSTTETHDRVLARPVDTAEQINQFVLRQ